MRNLFFLFLLSFGLTSCSDKLPVGDYPVIDIVNNIGNYQKMYCSDLFSSIELIPLETREECLVNITHPVRNRFILNDDFIFFDEYKHLYVFDHTGKFLHEIGTVGQGLGEFISVFDIFLNTEKPTIYINNLAINLLEYDFSGEFIRSIPIPKIDEIDLNHFSHVGEDLFVGHLRNTGKNKFNFCLLNEEGDTVKCFPNYSFFERTSRFITNFAEALKPVRVDKLLYLKSYINDTIYNLTNLTLEPAYVFDIGKYTLPTEVLSELLSSAYEKALLIESLIGVPKYFFYIVGVPDFFPIPKIEPRSLFTDMVEDRRVLGVYNIEEKNNILLDTNEDLEMMGFINDINGGLSFFPRYYAGNNVLVDLWDAGKMKTMLTEEYFASQRIKDPEEHQKLKEILKDLKEDSNPVIVIGKLK